VIIVMQRGATPEQIVMDFDTLKLADVYAVIAYYLRNEPEVEAYLADREAETERRESEHKSQPFVAEFDR
jgi:hypothetical protein